MLHWSGMGLAPCEFMRGNVSGFAKIVDARELVRSRLHQDPVRDTVVHVAAVIVRIRREYPGERIDPGARADAFGRH